MSNPLPPYSTFRTDNKVRQVAAGGTGGIRRLGRPEKAAEEFSTVRPFFGGLMHGRYLGRKGGSVGAPPRGPGGLSAGWIPRGCCALDWQVVIRSAGPCV